MAGRFWPKAAAPLRFNLAFFRYGIACPPPAVICDNPAFALIAPIQMTDLASLQKNLDHVMIAERHRLRRENVAGKRLVALSCPSHGIAEKRRAVRDVGRD